MKAIKNKLRLPVWGNIIGNPYGTATAPTGEPDSYVDAYEYRCPRCNSILGKLTNDSEFFSCYYCKDYRIEKPED